MTCERTWDTCAFARCRSWRLGAKGAGNTISTLLCSACGAARTLSLLRMIIYDVPDETIEEGRGHRVEWAFMRLKD